jgi:hypothetical protein
MCAGTSKHAREIDRETKRACIRESHLRWVYSHLAVRQGQVRVCLHGVCVFVFVVAVCVCVRARVRVRACVCARARVGETPAVGILALGGEAPLSRVPGLGPGAAGRVLCQGERMARGRGRETNGRRMSGLLGSDRDRENK